jgi:predicted RNase H-like HicB family nuclease
MKQHFSARTWREGDSVIAQCVEIDVASHGRSEEEAIENLREAMELYLEPPTATIIPRLVDIEVELGAA